MERAGVDIRDRIFSFVISIVKYSRTISNTQENFIIKRQIIRSVTSIGANATEADGASSKKDFVNKLMIAQREAKETLYWIRIINELGILSKNQFEQFYNEGLQIVKILNAIIISTKRK